jgi:coproporphyrinogen III oxidase
MSNEFKTWSQYDTIPPNVPNPTIIDWFIHEHRNEDSPVGDLSYDLRTDKTYPRGTTIEMQLHHIKLLAETYPEIIDTIEEFLKRLRNYQKITL